MVKKGKYSKNTDDRILRLFGRQIYPGSCTYEYFTNINSGLDSIKIPIDIKSKQELFDGDSVFIKQLNSYYEVELHRIDQPKYYPDII